MVRGTAAEVTASVEAWEGGGGGGQRGGGEREEREQRERERREVWSGRRATALCLFRATAALGGMKSRCGRWDGPHYHCPSHQYQYLISSIGVSVSINQYTRCR